MLRPIHNYAPAESAVVQFSRAEFFAGLFILGCANGLIVPMEQSIAELGWLGGIFSTFNISVIVLVACVSGVSLISRNRTDELRSVDVGVGAVFLMLVILPVGQLSWLAMPCSAFTSSCSRMPASRHEEEPLFSLRQLCPCSGASSCSISLLDPS